MNNDFINNITDFVQDKVDKVTRKTDKFLAIQGLKGQIRSTNREIDEHYIELGELVYERFCKGEIFPSDEAEHCEEIMKLTKLVDQYMQDIEAYKEKDDEFEEDWEDEDIVEESAESEEADDAETVEDAE